MIKNLIKNLCLIGFALIGPITLPAGGIQKNLNEYNVLNSSKEIILNENCILYTFPKTNATRLIVLDSGSSLSILRKLLVNKKESWARAMEALKYVQEAGMDPYLNVTVGHYNAKSEDLKQLLDYSKNHKYRTLVNVAVPSGMWKNVHDIICDEEDIEHIRNLRKEYQNMNRNLWNPFDKNFEGVLGCNTVNRLYITPIGDVLVCPYVHVKIGNVYEQSLKEIRDYGFSIRHFSDHSSSCLAGENKDFIRKYMSFENQSIFNPAIAKDIFTADDYVENPKLVK